MRRFAFVPLIAAVSASLLTAAPSQAHWNGVRWGMSKAELGSLYPSVNSPLSHGRNGVEGRISVNWIGVRWTRVAFTFGSRQELRSLRATTDASMEVLLQALTRRYGQRTREIGRSSDWSSYMGFFRDSATGDLIVVDPQPGALEVRWQPRLSTEDRSALQEWLVEQESRGG